MAKALVLTAGGLDSLLVVKLLQKIDFPIKCIHFDIGLTYNKPIMAGQRISKYFGLEYLVKNSIEIDKFDIAKEFYSKILSLHGIEKTNICLEHRIFLLKKAYEYMKNNNLEFIITGDIIDQRPLIQSKEMLLLSDKQANVEGLVFRPLSAKNLPKLSIFEKYPILLKIILDFKGFDPKREILAKELSITEYPKNPKLLKESESDMGGKAFDIFENDFTLNPAHLHRVGIHFKIKDDIKVIIGRTPFESHYLKKFFDRLDLKEGITFSTSEPRFIFGFLYGTSITPEIEMLSLQIFRSLLPEIKKDILINLFNYEGLPLGSKYASSIQLQKFSQYLLKINELSCPICPTFTLN